jgi:predicted lipoprotein with Yx(FWY)xxD motif
MRRLGVLGVTITPIALVAAACGSSSSSSPAPTTTGASAAKSATGTAVVSTKHNDKLGTILADSKGLTLYTLTSGGQPVPCTGQCLTIWPPLEVPAGTTPSGVQGLATAPAPDGSQLVTYQGKPLYRFMSDKASDDAYGQGIKSFGGVWNVQQVAAPGSAPASSGGASGGGY